MTRQLLVEVGEITIHQVQNAAVLLDDLAGEAHRLLVHRLPQRVRILGEQVEVGFVVIPNVAELEPVAEELIGQRRRALVSQEAAGLRQENLYVVEPPCRGRPQQLLIRSCRPQKIREPRRQLVRIEPARLDAGPLLLRQIQEVRRHEHAPRREPNRIRHVGPFVLHVAVVEAHELPNFAGLDRTPKRLGREGAQRAAGDRAQTPLPVEQQPIQKRDLRLRLVPCQLSRFLESQDPILVVLSDQSSFPVQSPVDALTDKPRLCAQEEVFLPAAKKLLSFSPPIRRQHRCQLFRRQVEHPALQRFPWLLGGQLDPALGAREVVADQVLEILSELPKLCPV